MGEAVTDDGAPDHLPGAPAERLDDAAGDHDFDRLRQQAAQGADDIQGDPEQQGPPPPVTIRHGPIEQLPGGQAHDVGGHRRLPGGAAGMERPDHARQCRQVHIDRDRPERGEDAEQDDEPQRCLGRLGQASGHDRQWFDARLRHNASLLAAGLSRVPPGRPGKARPRRMARRFTGCAAAPVARGSTRVRRRRHGPLRPSILRR